MTKGFYVPKSEEHEIKRFCEICEATGVNYSTQFLEWIKAFNKQNNHIKPLVKQSLKKG